MAYVAITKSLIVDTRRRLSSMEKAELQQLAFDSTDFVNDPLVQQKVDEALWEPAADIREKAQVIPGFVRQASLTLIVVPKASDGTELDRKAFSINSFEAPCFRLKEGSYYNMATIEVDLSDHPKLIAIADAMQAQSEVLARWAKVGDQVVGFLEKCKSLNEGVKLWPDLRRYIPKSYLDRLDAKTEAQRTKESAALAALKSLDLDTINASTVLARMASAGTTN